MGLGSPIKKYIWHLCDSHGNDIDVFHSLRLITSDMITLRNAAVAGVGVVQLPYMMISEQLRQGQLIPILPNWPVRREIIHAVFLSRRGLLPSVRTLIDYLTQRFVELQQD